MLIATPSFLQFRKNSELTTASNNLSTSLLMARSEAMRRSDSTEVVPAAGGWADGWNARLVSNSALLDQQKPIATYASDVTITGVNSFPIAGVAFNGDGYPAPGLGALPFVMIMSNGTRNRRITLQPSGQVRVCDPDAAAGTTNSCK